MRKKKRQREGLDNVGPLLDMEKGFHSHGGRGVEWLRGCHPVRRSGSSPGKRRRVWGPPPAPSALRAVSAPPFRKGRARERRWIRGWEGCLALKEGGCRTTGDWGLVCCFCDLCVKRREEKGERKSNKILTSSTPPHTINNTISHHQHHLTPSTTSGMTRKIVFSGCIALIMAALVVASVAATETPKDHKERVAALVRSWESALSGKPVNCRRFVDLFIEEGFFHTPAASSDGSLAAIHGQVAMHRSCDQGRYFSEFSHGLSCLLSLLSLSPSPSRS